MNDGAIWLHVMHAAVLEHCAARHLVEAADKRGTLIPVNEAGSMHCRIREAPQRVGGISDEMGSADDVVRLT